MTPILCEIALSASAILQHALPAPISNNAYMKNARDAVLREVEQMLADVDMKASPFAREAKVATTTLTRFMSNSASPLLSTSTLVKLRETRDRLLAARRATPNLNHLTKNAKKRALIARLLAVSDDQLVAIEDAIERAPKAAPASRKVKDDAV